MNKCKAYRVCREERGVFLSVRNITDCIVRFRQGKESISPLWHAGFHIPAYTGIEAAKKMKGEFSVECPGSHLRIIEIEYNTEDIVPLPNKGINLTQVQWGMYNTCHRAENPEHIWGKGTIMVKRATMVNVIE